MQAEAEAVAARADPGRGVQTLRVVEQLFLLMRTLGSHGTEHPLTRDTATALCQAVHEAAPPFALQFVGHAVFRDTVLLPMDLEHYHQATAVGDALRNLDVHEVTFERVPGSPEALRFGGALSRGHAGPSDLLSLMHLDGIRWREIRNIAGSDSELVDPAVFALTQMTLALAEAERLPAQGAEAWPWVLGVAIVRRLERAVTTDASATLRVVDLAPGEWTVSRRAVAAALDVLLVLHGLEVTHSTLRGAPHAALILGMAGFGARGGQPVQTAAQQALPGIIRSPVTSRSGVEPHRLRTSAVVHAIARPAREDAPRVLPLVDLAYELARARCPDTVPFDLGRVDLLAMATRQAGRRFDADWVAALVGACGVLPPGAVVRLADGRLGAVVEPGEDGDPWRPRVLVDGCIAVPDQPVSLVSPAAARAGGG